MEITLPGVACWRFISKSRTRWDSSTDPSQNIMEKMQIASLLGKGTKILSWRRGFLTLVKKKEIASRVIYTQTEQRTTDFPNQAWDHEPCSRSGISWYLLYQIEETVGRATKFSTSMFLHMWHIWRIKRFDWFHSEQVCNEVFDGAKWLFHNCSWTNPLNGSTASNQQGLCDGGIRGETTFTQL